MHGVIIAVYLPQAGGFETGDLTDWIVTDPPVGVNQPWAVYLTGQPYGGAQAYNAGMKCLARHASLRMCFQIFLARASCRLALKLVYHHTIGGLDAQMLILMY
jgi:hypothetical protein